MNDLDVNMIRKNAGLSQEDLANLLGVHIRTIQRWENGGAVPETKRALLGDIEKNPAKYMASGSSIGHTINAPINVYSSEAVDKLIEVILAKETALQKMQEQMTELIEIIKKKETPLNQI